MFFYATVLYDLRMSATVCGRGHLNDGGRRGRRRLFVSFGDSHCIVLQIGRGLSIWVPNAGQPHHLDHHQGLCLPPKAGSLKRKRKPGV
jgi:hypothetical protein